VLFSRFQCVLMERSVRCSCTNGRMWHLWARVYMVVVKEAQVAKLSPSAPCARAGCRSRLTIARAPALACAVSIPPSGRMHATGLWATRPKRACCRCATSAKFSIFVTASTPCTYVRSAQYGCRKSSSTSTRMHSALGGTAVPNTFCLNRSSWGTTNLRRSPTTMDITAPSSSCTSCRTPT
jgi:hypothetical protein